MPTGTTRSTATTPATRGHITIIPTPHGWAADYTHTDKAEQFAELFGTTVLPLPFTSQAPRTDVVAHMRRVEPLAEIR